jgi:LytS/YehU family sensor histidine kinase
MLAGLGDLLRYVLEDSPGDEVLLRDEVAFITRYLEIERVRFTDRLRVTTDVAEETLDAFVPNLLLQPLVENAIVHGIARQAGAGSIEIAARKLGERLVLQVRDNGPGLIGIARETPGVGLSNSRKRLGQLYGDQFSFDVRNGDDGGVVVIISLPFQLKPITPAFVAAG